ncbi:hypothetical protein FD754_013360, partial [Muntiacus muntjak]
GRSSGGGDEEGSSLEETGFNWGEYLEETGASAAPHTSFKHVEISIQSNFQPGMKLEVANKKNPDTYWVATVITTCGQLLLLRYCGYGEDRRADFWCDVVIADLHPVGWCTQNNKTLMPPDEGRVDESILLSHLGEKCGSCPSFRNTIKFVSS